MDEAELALVEQVCGPRSSGAITTNFDRSKPICRSIRGRVPRPIEPKPIITIGPVESGVHGLAFGHAGDCVHIGHSKANGEQAHAARRRGATKSDLERTGKAGNERGEIGLRLEAGRSRRSARARRRARPATSSQASSRSRSYGPGSQRPAGLLAREAEAGVIGGIARPAARRRWPSLRAAASECAAPARLPMPRLRRSQATASGPSSSAGRRGPAEMFHSAPCRSRGAGLARDERQPLGRQPALAQALGGLGETAVAEGLIEQRFARPRCRMRSRDGS